MVEKFYFRIFHSYSILEPIKIFRVLFANNDKRVQAVLNNSKVKYLVFKERVRDFQVSIMEIFMDCMIVDPMTAVLKPKAFRRHDAYFPVSIRLS